MKFMDTAAYREFAAAIRAEFGEDDELVADVLEGETDFADVIGTLIEADAEAKAFAAACRELERSYRARAASYAARSEAIAGRIHQLLQSAGLRRFEHAAGSVSIRPTPRRVIVSAEPDDLPPEFQRLKVEADKVALKAALEDGREIPGAFLGNGGETIAIRRA